MNHAPRTRRFAGLAAFALLLTSSGCANPYRYEPCPPHVSDALGEAVGRRAEVKLFYATDRRRTGISQPALFYGAERADDLRVGTCRVSIPEGHGLGRIETPAPLLAENPDRHVVLMNVSAPMPRPAFLAALQQQIAKSQRREVLVFVHGYAMLFSEAARRAAQIAHDIDLDGVVIVYSWPAQGWLLSYLVDAVNVEWTEPHMIEFLAMLADESGAERLHLLAHSMGCRVVARAVRQFVLSRPNTDRPGFDQIILAAADIDARIFERDYAPYLARACRRMTIYASAVDWALGSSQFLHKYPRLGQPTFWRDIEQVAGRIEIVDASPVDRGVIGHIYYGSSPDVLEDLRGVLDDRSPEERGLTPSGHLHRIHPRTARTAIGVRSVAP
ncbi:MAG: alpha/beta fold hydrolase [Phycisphaerae bacterium]|nr:alpha/beta fold hydrolase [Phycisphaerae bacterium]NUQ45886.1 alpha/beta fold hydrolase [Phycisphaerae bacterium]